MADDIKNKSELEIEKLRLEIESLKNSVIQSKKTKTWEDYIKPIIPVAVTLIIAIFGWIITVKYNQAQLTITDNKNKSDKELAQINASLSFIKLLTEISNGPTIIRQQAKTVIAPVLPPETSFNIAVNELPDNPDVLKILIRSYKNESWKYLTFFLEFYPLKYIGDEFWNTFNRRIVDRLNLAGTDSMFNVIEPMFNVIERMQLIYKKDNSEQSNRKYFLLNFLENNQLLNDFFKYLISNDYKSKNRVFSILNYFEYIYYSQDIYYETNRRIQKKYEIIDLINNISDNILKTDLSTAFTIVFVNNPSDERDWPLIALTAKYYWEDLDITSGDIPADGSLKQFLYERYYHFDFNGKRYQNVGAEILSEKLF